MPINGLSSEKKLGQLMEFDLYCFGLQFSPQVKVGLRTGFKQKKKKKSRLDSFRRINNCLRRD